MSTQNPIRPGALLVSQSTTISGRPGAPDRAPDFSVCVLLYGGYVQLARRCLDAIAALPGADRVEVRIGTNAVGAETQEFVRTYAETETARGRRVLLYSAADNIGKYPMMRRMCRDPFTPVRAPHVMWFDDDSFIKTPTADWLDRVAGVLERADMCGAVMRCNLIGNQPVWVTMQPWYRGVPIECLPRPCVRRFAVGGWWAVRAPVLAALDWPPPGLVHRGGDVMLGEALRQHGYRVADFTDGVAINADALGQNHLAPRRGLDGPPVGADYNPPLSVIVHDATKAIDPKLLDHPGL